MRRTVSRQLWKLFRQLWKLFLPCPIWRTTSLMLQPHAAACRGRWLKRGRGPVLLSLLPRLPSLTPPPPHPRLFNPHFFFFSFLPRVIFFAWTTKICVQNIFFKDFSRRRGKSLGYHRLEWNWEWRPGRRRQKWGIKIGVLSSVAEPEP